MRSSNRVDRIAVITGASKGLGRELSLTFAKAGYGVVGLYRSDLAAAELLTSEFRSNDLCGHFVRQDITDEGKWTEFEAIIGALRNKHFTLVANASARFEPRPFHLYDWHEILNQLEVNLKGTQLVFKRLLPAMVKARMGTLVTVLSTVLDHPSKGFASYMTAKAALDGFTKAAAVEYSERGLKIFSVSPDFMRTPLTDGWNDHLRELVTAKGGAPAMPSEIAEKILALVEDVGTVGTGENYCLRMRCQAAAQN